jgi:hypothetical protein
MTPTTTSERGFNVGDANRLRLYRVRDEGLAKRCLAASPRGGGASPLACSAARPVAGSAQLEVDEANAVGLAVLRPALPLVQESSDLPPASYG